MKDEETEKKNDKEAKKGTRTQSHNFSKDQLKRRRYLIFIGIPVVVVAITLSVSFGIQTSEQQRSQGTQMAMHIHPILSVEVDGKNMTVPKDVGINSSLWKDRSLDQYGMPGMAPLHTHDESGVIHVESTANRDFTFGEFLNIWGGLDESINDAGATGVNSLNVTINNKPIADFRNHVLSDGEKINLEIGG